MTLTGGELWMPNPRWVARTNRYWLNPVARRVAPWMPGFGVVVHRGRTSGRTYRTPVNVFRRADGYLIALTYGPQADWVRNVLAADGCTLVTGRRSIELVAPEVYRDESRAEMPGIVRAILGAIKSYEFLRLRVRSPEP